jgi:transposase
MPDPTSCAAVVADTILRTVELGVTITDAPLDADTTVSYYNLLDIGRRHCVEKQAR